MLSWPLGSGCELERRKSSGENQIINDGYLCNHRFANSTMLCGSSMSTFMTFIIALALFFLTLGSAASSDMQASALEGFLTARMTVEILRTRSWRAVSKPRSELAPVTRATLAVRLIPAGKGCNLGCVNADSMLLFCGRIRRKGFRETA